MVTGWVALLGFTFNSQSWSEAYDLFTAFLFIYDGYVGILINTSTESYYRFTAQRDGQHTMTLGGYICSGSSYLELTLHDKDGFGSDLAFSGDDACSQSVQASLEAGQEYYITVQNWRMADSWNRTGSRPAPGRIGFTLNMQ